MSGVCFLLCIFCDFMAVVEAEVLVFFYENLDKDDLLALDSAVSFIWLNWPGITLKVILKGTFCWADKCDINSKCCVGSSIAIIYDKMQGCINKLNCSPSRNHNPLFQQSLKISWQGTTWYKLPLICIQFCSVACARWESPILFVLLSASDLCP